MRAIPEVDTRAGNVEDLLSRIGIALHTMFDEHRAPKHLYLSRLRQLMFEIDEQLRGER